MEMLRERMHVVPLASLVTGGRADGERPACAVTFDDGYAGVREYVLPTLARFDLPAMVYLTTDAVGKSSRTDPDLFTGLTEGERMLTWNQVRELAEGNVTVGSHLCRHVNLTRLSEAEARRQLDRSRCTIEERLGRPCVDLSYPWGLYNAAVAGWARDAGYRTAAVGVHAPVPHPVDPYAIPRMAIRSGYSLADFEAILNGEWDFLGIVQWARHRLSA